jgi:hypothetical protein
MPPVAFAKMLVDCRMIDPVKNCETPAVELTCKEAMPPVVEASVLLAPSDPEAAAFNWATTYISEAVDGTALDTGMVDAPDADGHMTT